MAQSDQIRMEASQWADSLNSVSRSLDTAELTIVCAGLVANLIGSITLFISHQMSTPSFVYHKALGLANLAYCSNFILVKILRYHVSEHRFDYGSYFPNYFTAYYMGVISRSVASICGYFVMYMSLLIIVDRFLALMLLARYHKFNKDLVATRLAIACLLLSVFVHSWSPWFENTVDEISIQEGLNSSHTHSVMYAVIPNQGNRNLRTAIAVKDVYNLVIRLAYAIGQSVLTVFVIRAFYLQNRRRRALRIAPIRRNSRGGQVIMSGRERSLCYLMLTVALLSCIQVFPREFKRVFDFVCPLDTILPSIADQSLPIDTRRKYMLLAVIGHGYWKLIANALTAIERSILFYLYFMFNHHFRLAVLAPLRRWIERRDLRTDGSLVPLSFPVQFSSWTLVNSVPNNPTITQECADGSDGREKGIGSCLSQILAKTGRKRQQHSPVNV